MRLGVNTVPEHKTPEEWAEKLEGIGCRAASFPVDFRAPVSVIDAYVKTAKEHDTLIAEVGVWNSPNDTDETKALAAQSVCVEQFEAFDTLGTYIKSCHLKDCILEDGTTVSIQEVPPGQGTMDNLHYMERIRELDKDMPVLLEHAADWNAYKQGMAYAKTMVEKLKEGQNEISA